MTKRYGIAEWFGQDFTELSTKDIQRIASNPPKDCPFRFPEANCNKAGGVCSLRLYVDDPSGTKPADDQIVTTCPNRFIDKGTIFSQVAHLLIGTKTPVVATEIPFLLSVEDNKNPTSVGMIDMVLVDSDSDPLNWCAMEIQAVYFSGNSMTNEIKEYKRWVGPGIPFPLRTRRPDFRSSGPKRLMPQLQIKVPTVSRWGRKTAVVVDRAFWNSLSPMSTVQHLSNCDIAWFVMDYTKSQCGIELTIDSVHLTTLEDAVAGLTAGIPTSVGDFESRLKEKMKRSGFRVQP